MTESGKMDFSAGRNDSSCRKTFSVKKMIADKKEDYERLIAKREEEEL